MLESEVNFCQRRVRELWPRSNWADARFQIFAKDIGPMPHFNTTVDAIDDHARERSTSPDYKKLMLGIRNANKRASQASKPADQVGLYETLDDRMTQARKDREEGRGGGARRWREKHNQPEAFAQLSHDTQLYCKKLWGDGYGTGAPLVDVTERYKQTLKKQEAAAKLYAAGRIR